MSLLQLEDATIKFGGLIAVNSVSFALEKGDLFGLIGPNGAGKTTCFNLITGVYQPTAGRIIYDGKPIAYIKEPVLDSKFLMAVATVIAPLRRLVQPRTFGHPSHMIAALGICRTFQNIRLFGALSVLENVMVGALLRHRTPLVSALADLPPAINETGELKKQAMDILEIVELDRLADSRSADLPYGSQRRLEIARALATQPELLLLDEPAAGMNPQEKMELLTVVRKIRDDHGKTVLLIDHDMKFVMNLCEKIVVLDHGEEIAAGPPEKIRNDPKVIEAYLGEAV